MITKWFKIWTLSKVKAVSTWKILDTPITATDGSVYYVDIGSTSSNGYEWMQSQSRLFLYPTDTNIYQSTPNITEDAMRSWKSYGGYISMCYGSGTTEPTPYDYKLEKNITTLRCTSAPAYTCTFNESTGCLNIIFNGSITATADCTISEVGIIKSFFSRTNAASTGTRSTKTFLVSRDLLPKPITLKKGESLTTTVILEI